MSSSVARSGKGARESSEVWSVFVNDANGNPGLRGNDVRTSRYRWWSFLPQTLWEQFGRSANLYFLIISVLQLTTPYSPTNRLSTVIPLCAVLLVSIGKELVEDVARHEADRKVNSRWARVARGAEWVKARWDALRPGDVVLVQEGEEAPADMVVLSTSDTEQGLAYVETAALDGESNLKFRRSVESTREGRNGAEEWSGVHAEIQCEEPNPRLYDFKGQAAWKETGARDALSNDEVVLRSMVLRNTAWMVGAIVYAGQDTKLSKNARGAPSKTSRVDRTVNRAIVVILATLVGIVLISVLYAALWRLIGAGDNGAKGHASYLPWESSDPGFLDWIGLAVTFLILYNNLVPISLYVSLEIVRIAQAKAIEQDPALQDPRTGKKALARTSDLNEDLGQIEFVFTDKTGTLTENCMIFRQCAIGAHAYGLEGNDPNDDDFEDQQQTPKPPNRTTANIDEVHSHRSDEEQSEIDDNINNTNNDATLDDFASNLSDRNDTQDLSPIPVMKPEHVNNLAMHRVGSTGQTTMKHHFIPLPSKTAPNALISPTKHTTVRVRSIIFWAG